MHPSRIACLYVPFFPLAAILRGQPELRHETLAVVEGKGHLTRIVAATLSAQQCGIMPGLSVPQARALLPELLFKSRNMEAEKTAHQAFIEVAEAFSPRIEEEEFGVIYLDLYSEKNEPFFAESLCRYSLKMGIPARVGIAGNKYTARIAAENLSEGALIVPLDSEAEFLKPYPIQRLRLPLKLEELMDSWGIKTIGAFAALPEKEILGRLGKEAQIFQQKARGIDQRPFVPRPHIPNYVEGTDLEWALLSLEPFILIARGLLERLLFRLQATGLGFRQIELHLKLDPQGNEGRIIDFPAPTRDIDSLLNLLQIDLEAHPPAEPIIGVRIKAQPEKPRQVQLALFGSPAISPDALATTLARLSALLGPDRVGSPEAVDGYRPERFVLKPYSLPEANDGITQVSASAQNGTLIAIRTLRPPIELEVLMGDISLAKPTRIRSIMKDPSQVEICGEVICASGPWRIEDEWWTEKPGFRDYWDLELSDGGIYRIYHDPRQDRWFADGVYD